MKRIVLAGTSSNVGKTSMTLSILKGFCKKGFNVQPFKVGPDYIDPAFHSHITGRKSRNLDLFMMGEEGVKYSFIKNMKNADIGVVEGVMGMFDGASTQKDTGSTAHLSKVLKAPVLLIIDGSGIAASAAAMVKGYMTYDPEVEVSGVLVNKVSGDHHYQLIKTAIERDLHIPCLGYLKKNPDIQLGSRHLGLVPAGELASLNAKIETLGEMALETIDLDAIYELTEGMNPLQTAFELPLMQEHESIRIAIARDRAFNFYYEDNLDYLRELGGELVEFSPLEDSELPEQIHGLVIGGGFPEVFAEELTANEKMRKALHEAIEDGLPTYAECGGFMFLNQQIVNFRNESFEMLQIFNGVSEMTSRLQRFGYVDVELNQDTVIGQKGWKLKGHEFHRSLVTGINNAEFAYNVQKIRDGKLLKEWKGGASKGNVLGAYAHMHFYACPPMSHYFIGKCLTYKAQKRT